MKNFVSELETLLDSMPIAVAIQDFAENQIVINNEARKLLTVEEFDVLAFRRRISSMGPGTHELIYGAKQIFTECSMVHLRDRTLKMCIFRDISEQNLTKNREQIYKACLDSITDMNLFACDAKGTILLYNTASAQSDQVSGRDIVGRNMYEVFGYESDTAIRRALTTGEPVLDWESHYDAQGRPIRNIGSAYPIKSDGKVIGAFSINRSYAGMRELLTRTIDLQKQLISVSNSRKNGTTYDFDSIIGNSASIRSAVELAKRVSNSAASVLIYGETGTGKELFAQSIHNAGINAGQPFLAINCAAIPETLLESTLFGTVRGAFTGADNMAGLFEQAGEGTLFLDEVNSLPIGLQAKLLRVLQERVYRRVGGKNDLPVQCRILSACNRPPMDCIEDHTLRSDLYYRLAAVYIEVPPLRERPDDVPLLVNHFLDLYAQVYGVSHIKVSSELMDLLKKYNWQGNVRELRHVIESAILQLEPGEELRIHHFPEVFTRQLRPNVPRLAMPVSKAQNTPYDLEAQLQTLRRQAIRDALEQTGWNVSKAAKLIGYSRTTLQYQMEKLMIKADE